MPKLPALHSADEARGDDLQRQLIQLMDHHRASLMTLRLITYAADAARVFNRLESHCAQYPSMAQSLRAACPDWRNPGCLDDPTDLITNMLEHSVLQMQALFDHLQELADQPA